MGSLADKLLVHAAWDTFEECEQRIVVMKETGL